MIKGMRIPWRNISWVLLLFFAYNSQTCNGQDYGGEDLKPAAPPPDQETCDGIFVTYNFDGREKIYPLVKNVSAQGWSFKSMLTVLNTGLFELKSWQVFVGFQHKELLVSADGAVAIDGDGFPVRVGKNGTTLAGYPQSDLKTAIDTAGDFTQMSAQINIKGTQFGLSEKTNPMPSTIKLVNEGYKCPAPKRYKAGSLDGIIDTVSAIHPLLPLINLLKSHGKLVMLGAPEKPLEPPVSPLLLGRKLVAGSFIGGIKETQEMVDFAAKHNITPDVEVVPMDYVNTTLEHLLKSDVEYRFVIDIDNTLNKS